MNPTIPEVTIPYKYTPRKYQLPVLRAIDSGKKRIVIVWHRRSGKDKTMFNVVVKRMVQNVGQHYYFFPTYEQGRKALWEAIDKDGFKLLNHIPKEIVKSIDNHQMRIELVNGSVFRVIGTDKIDAVVGTNPITCVYSEYSLQDPLAWQLMRPVLAENGGVAIFNYTPRGDNHGKKLYETAKKDDEWFVQKLTVDDTKALPQEVIDREQIEMRADNGDDNLFYQEYFCSFDAPVQGSYYGTLMQDADRTGRIKSFAVDARVPVHTVWDIGVGDSTAIGFFQIVGSENRIVDYYENSGEGIQHYIHILQSKGYVYGQHYAPHDIEIREFSTGVSRLETAKTFGIKFETVPKLPIAEGIQAVRSILPQMYFEKDKTERLVLALKDYHKKRNEKMKTWSETPEHNWASHPADMMRYFAIVANKLSGLRRVNVNVQDWMSQIPKRKKW